jgi:hypothetical protein
LGEGAENGGEEDARVGAQRVERRGRLNHSSAS